MVELSLNNGQSLSQSVHSGWGPKSDTPSKSVILRAKELASQPDSQLARQSDGQTDTSIKMASVVGEHIYTCINAGAQLFQLAISITTSNISTNWQLAGAPFLWSEPIAYL